MRKIFGIVAAALALSGCANGANSDSMPGAESLEDINVFAAASLHQVFPEIGEKVFTPDNPGRQLRFSFDGSASLIDQISAGAPAQVLATADKTNMERAIAAGLVETPRAFTVNTLVVAIPRDNPGHIGNLTDLTPAGHKRIVVCAPEVPCGAAGVRWQKKLAVKLNVVSEETSVTAVVGKLLTGQADAGLIYATDAAAHREELHVIDIPGAPRVHNEYWIAPVRGNNSGAQEFMAAVEKPAAMQIMKAAGFESLPLPGPKP